MDKHENLKHANQSGLAIPDSPEDKEDFLSISPEKGSENSGAIRQELESIEPVPTDVPQHEDLKNEEKVQNYQMLETLGQDHTSGSHLANEHESSKFEAKEKPNRECEID